MNTKFFFTLPVVAMFAMTMTTTVANAAVRKAEVNKVVRVEALSVNNVDFKVDAKLATPRDKASDEIAKVRSVRDKAGDEIAKVRTSVVGGDEIAVREKGVRDNIDFKVDANLAKRVRGYDATLTAKGWLDSKANTKLAMPIKKRLPGVRY